jgi:protein-S-isoprenylcysteine O-methyltransferase Ste14
MNRLFKLSDSLVQENLGIGDVRLSLKNLVLFVFLVFSTLVVVPLVLVWLSGGLLAFSVGGLRFLGFVLIGVGTVFMLNMFVYFASVGKGTPAPFDPPKKLVTGGLFRHVRNPGYIGGVFIIVGEGVFLEAAVVFGYAAFMWIMFHLYVVFFEERSLKEKFGKDYEKYLEAVPRWIPKLTRVTEKALKFE